MDTAALGDKIVRVLKTIFDPEIPVDIYELGLIYDVFVNEDNDVKILMTLTTPNRKINLNNFLGCMIFGINKSMLFHVPIWSIFIYAICYIL